MQTNNTTYVHVSSQTGNAMQLFVDDLLLRNLPM